MNIAFRVDASHTMGTGHLMRCLTLARVLRARGSRCVFASRLHAGNLVTEVAAAGFDVRVLSGSAAAEPSSGEGLYAGWLGTSWRSDAEQTVDVLGPGPWDWLVVDHYALDRRWEMATAGIRRRLLIIDDLADRRHDADLLLDQTLGRVADSYFGLVNTGCECWCGASHALLRPEFARLREYSLRRRELPHLKSILVSLGGVDQDNFTRRILLALEGCGLGTDVAITVVLGSASPWVEDIQRLAGELSIRVDVRVGVSNMAQLMSDSDLAIGAAGTSAWERCCLGLPTLMLVIAENQRVIAQALESARAVWLLESGAELAPQLGAMLGELSGNLTLLRAMSDCASAVLHGGGTERLAQRLETTQ